MPVNGPNVINRVSKIERIVGEIKTELVGLDGRSGLLGEIRQIAGRAETAEDDAREAKALAEKNEGRLNKLSMVQAGYTTVVGTVAMLLARLLKS